MDADFCLIHGFEFMKKGPGPVASCTACEAERECDQTVTPAVPSDTAKTEGRG